MRQALIVRAPEPAPLDPLGCTSVNTGGPVKALVDVQQHHIPKPGANQCRLRDFPHANKCDLLNLEILQLIQLSWGIEDFSSASFFQNSNFLGAQNIFAAFELFAAFAASAL